MSVRLLKDRHQRRVIPGGKPRMTAASTALRRRARAARNSRVNGRAARRARPPRDRAHTSTKSGIGGMRHARDRDWFAVRERTLATCRPPTWPSARAEITPQITLAVRSSATASGIGIATGRSRASTGSHGKSLSIPPTPGGSAGPDDEVVAEPVEGVVRSADGTPSIRRSDHCGKWAVRSRRTNEASATSS
jgi:hypothetical protein